MDGHRGSCWPSRAVKLDRRIQRTLSWGVSITTWECGTPVTRYRGAAPRGPAADAVPPSIAAVSRGAVVPGGLGMRLVPDGRVLPRLTPAGGGRLRPPGAKIQQRRRQDDRQRDADEHEDGLCHVHGARGPLTGKPGSCTRTPRPDGFPAALRGRCTPQLPPRWAPLRPRARRLQLRDPDGVGLAASSGQPTNVVQRPAIAGPEERARRRWRLPGDVEQRGEGGVLLLPLEVGRAGTLGVEPAQRPRRRACRPGAGGRRSARSHPIVPARGGGEGPASTPSPAVMRPRSRGQGPQLLHAVGGTTGSVVPGRGQTCSKEGSTSGPSRPVGTSSTSCPRLWTDRAVRRRGLVRCFCFRRLAEPADPQRAGRRKVEARGLPHRQRRRPAGVTIHRAGNHIKLVRRSMAPARGRGPLVPRPVVLTAVGALLTRPRDSLMPNRPLCRPGCGSSRRRRCPCVNGSIPGHNRDGRAAAGPAREPGRVPGGPGEGGPDEVVVGVAGEPELRGVGLADAEGGGGGQRGDHVVVDVGHEIAVAP